MFYLKTGTYLRFVVLNAEVHFIGIGSFPEDDAEDTSSFIRSLDSNFMFKPCWEAVGVNSMLEFREDKNTVRFYIADDVLYDYKKVMHSVAKKRAKEFYPDTAFEYNEMPAGSFHNLCRSFTFTRTQDGTWEEADLPPVRAVFSSVQKGEASMDYSEAILKIADMLPEACGTESSSCGCDGNCECDGKCGSEGNCGCSKTANWYEGSTTESNWYEDLSSESNWYEEGNRMADEDDWDDEVHEADFDVDAKRTDRSEIKEYKKRRRRMKQNPSMRRQLNKKLRKRNRKPSFKLDQKRKRKRNKNKPKSRRRSPRKY